MFKLCRDLNEDKKLFLTCDWKYDDSLDLSKEALGVVASPQPPRRKVMGQVSLKFHTYISNSMNIFISFIQFAMKLSDEISHRTYVTYKTSYR